VKDGFEMNELEKYMRLYLSEGLSFFPMPYKSKNPIGDSWKEYQTRKPTLKEIKRWSRTKCNIAVLCGSVSDNLVILDCDLKLSYTELSSRIQDKYNIRKLTKFTRITKTSQGYHIWFKVNQLTETTGLYSLDIWGDGNFRWDGSYVSAPPSVHPSGLRYQFLLNRPIARVETLEDILNPYVKWLWKEHPQGCINYYIYWHELPKVKKTLEDMKNNS
jgi:hypothetical protein